MDSVDSVAIDDQCSSWILVQHRVRSILPAAPKLVRCLTHKFLHVLVPQLGALDALQELGLGRPLAAPRLEQACVDVRDSMAFASTDPSETIQPTECEA